MLSAITNHIDSIATSAVTAVLVFFITSRIDNKLREKNNKHEFIRNREYDTHENVYEEIQKLKNDPETGWAFRSSKKEKLEEQNNLSFSEFCNVTKRIEFHNLNIDGAESYILDIIKDKIISDIKKLSRRSKNKIQQISKEIIIKYENDFEVINSEVDDLVEGFGYYEGKKLSFDESNYVSYCKTQREIVLLNYLAPLLNKLEIELSDYINLK